MSVVTSSNRNAFNEDLRNRAFSTNFGHFTLQLASSFDFVQLDYFCFTQIPQFLKQWLYFFTVWTVWLGEYHQCILVNQFSSSTHLLIYFFFIINLFFYYFFYTNLNFLYKNFFLILLCEIFLMIDSELFGFLNLNELVGILKHIKKF